MSPRRAEGAAPQGPVARVDARAWAVWAVAVAAYLVAVFQRSSLAVAALQASERFDLDASRLATFTVLQLLVYAGMQVPVGLLVDRFGPRAVLVTGAFLMALGQTTFALATSYAAALPARAIVGVGDALTFICALRLVASWFPTHRVGLITQLTGTLGQLGAFVAAAPLVWALGRLGWTGAYLVTAGLSGLAALAGLLVLADAPGRRRVRGEVLSLATVRRLLRESWSHPGTRLGFWIHFTTPFSATTFSLLWGYPFLVEGQGLSPAAASGLLGLMVLAVMASGPVLGWGVGEHPWHRSTMALGIVAVMVGVWTAVLARSTPAPHWLLVLLVLAIGVGGPASMIGFDVGRTSNTAARLASASGIINVAGFTAALLAVLCVGLVLDARTPEGAEHTLAGFRVAMAVQYPLWGLGAVQVLRYRRRARAVIDRAELERLTTRSRRSGPHGTPGRA